ncbi:membrane protein [Rhizobium wenxiniae]|uniref:CBS domain-containing membrane protein n=1 Tax=Rhizobium wenxiniae TaxID=1737357 RepID=A0A7W9Y2F6_9HYPH|nr:HPP family protein [Rhizobium wenxiniae]MBB6160567.1 CBS domain-containing membrane protein [Rhizobium wenxiniae]GGF82419.1 membrane protein [Rhizobium wenxiniae]
MLSMLRRMLPDTQLVSKTERLRASSGALLGILITGLVAGLAVGLDPALPALIAPMGASAVLLFAVPASPLAQPWSILGGNTVAAITGVSVSLLVPDPFFAAALAIGIAIGLMMTLRCLHPPSGAIALTAVLGGPAIHDLGYAFVIWPVLGNSLALLALALLYNNVTGRRYPHRANLAPVDHRTRDPAPIQRIGFSSDDLDEVLKDYDAFLDIDRDDLESILRRTELRSYRRRAGDLTCKEIMSRDVVAVSPDESLRNAHVIMRSRHLKALPVTNDAAEVVGIVTQTDFLDKPNWIKGEPTIGFRHRLRLIAQGASAANGTVKDIMTSPVKTIGPDASLSDAIIMFAEQGLHYLPVVGENRKMVGILSQSDVLIATLEAATKGDSRL